MDTEPEGFGFYKHVAATVKSLIWSVVTHAFPHADEVGLIWLAMRFAAELFPGIKPENVSYLSFGDEELDWRKAARAGRICAGVGPNAPCNEHVSHNSKGNKGHCSATLFANGLGLSQQDHVLWRILNAINDNDVSGNGQGVLAMPGTIMMLHENNVAPNRVIAWAIEGFNALYDARVKKLSKETSPVLFDRLVAEWISERWAAMGGRELWINLQTQSPDCWTLGMLEGLKDLMNDQGLNLIAESVLHYVEKKQGTSVLDLRRVVDEMNVLGVSHSQIKEWLTLALEAVYADGHRYQMAMSIVRRDPSVIRLSVKGPLFAVNLIAAQTDNTKFGRVARTPRLEDGAGNPLPRADVIIQQQPSGNVQIFFNKKTLSGQHFEAAELRLRAVLRMREAMANGRPFQGKDIPPLDVAGRHPSAPEWYVHATGLLNGARSAPGISPTKLTLLVILEIIKNVFENYGKELVRPSAPNKSTSKHPSQPPKKPVSSQKPNGRWTASPKPSVAKPSDPPKPRTCPSCRKDFIPPAMRHKSGEMDSDYNCQECMGPGPVGKLGGKGDEHNPNEARLHQSLGQSHGRSHTS